ncbi:MAG: hypothetical protein M0P09_01280 [Acholeplasmataceae bacterium]|nr:hypothetical protein [Acholeplasmataceae bacterium]
MNDLFNYISLSKNADWLIAKFGDKCNVVTYTDVPDPNPIKPPTRTKMPTSTRGVFLRYRVQDIDGVNILRADQRVLLPSSISDVQMQGYIERGSEVWKIIHVERLKPGPVGMIWKLQVRQ